jgi:hypothetical protein
MEPDPARLAWLKYLYTNKTHDDFVHAVLWTTLIIFAYFCAGAYLKIRANLNLVRTNWIQLRCNPAYIPFAGFIMKPTDMTKDAYTEMNFEYCVQNELKAISSDFMEPLYYTQSVAMSTIHGIANALNDLRTLIKNIRDALSSIIADIMSRVLNVMQPVVGILLSARDMMGKIQGLMTASLYTLYGTYDSIQSGLKSVYEIIVIILIAMAAAIVLLWVAVAIAAAFGPFGIPALMIATAAAGVLTAIYVGIAIPMGIIAHFLAETMHIQGLSLVPDPPSRG